MLCLASVKLVDLIFGLRPKMEPQTELWSQRKTNISQCMSLATASQSKQQQFSSVCWCDSAQMVHSVQSLHLCANISTA